MTEHEELIEAATWALIESDTDTADRGVSKEHYRERRADVERIFPILAAGYRKQEPVTEPEWEFGVMSRSGIVMRAHSLPNARAMSEVDIRYRGWTPVRHQVTHWEPVPVGDSDE